MTDHIDEFQSMFKRAERERFVYVDIPIESVAFVTDKKSDANDQVRDAVLRFLPRLESTDALRVIGPDDYANVNELLAKIDETQTDLIVTYRHLGEESLIPQHSLGVYLDVLTQTTSIPVLVLPGTAIKPHPFTADVCDRVMVVADHISGDNRLINYGVRLCRNGGTIWLCHVEDEKTFERYMAAIERIPEIETSSARNLIDAELLREANQFIEDCTTELREKGPNLSCESSVTKGHFLRKYRELIDQHEIELLVANTKDDDQLAMHGTAYSLSVEVTDIPMLLL